jgi:hypothetical protein
MRYFPQRRFLARLEWKPRFADPGFDDRLYPFGERAWCDVKVACIRHTSAFHVAQYRGAESSRNTSYLPRTRRIRHSICLLFFAI